jgi:hypothetical protein
MPLEASPSSPEPHEKTQRKTQRSVKSGKEGVEKQQEHQGKIGKIEDQPKMRSISGGTQIERTRLIKDNISRYPYPMSDQIPTTITLMFCTIT